MKLNPEILLYRKNSMSYNLVLISLMINTYVLISTINVMLYDTHVGYMIIFNIILTLIVFLTAVNVNTYKMVWSFVAILFAFVQIARAFWFTPEVLYTLDHTYKFIFFSYTSDLGRAMAFFTIISSVFAFSSGLIGIKRTKARINVIKRNNQSKVNSQEV